jgi:hypothetical protein
LSGTVVLREKWPVIGRHEQAAAWLQIWTDPGRAPRTIDAYARGLAEYLLVCEREGVDPVTADRAWPRTCGCGLQDRSADFGVALGGSRDRFAGGGHGACRSRLAVGSSTKPPPSRFPPAGDTGQRLLNTDQFPKSYGM